MPWQKKSRTKGERVVRRKLPDGSIREYRYPKYTPRPHASADSVEGLIDAYKSSPEWAALAPSTRNGRSAYLRHLLIHARSLAKDVTAREITEIHDTLRVERGNGSAGGFLSASRALFSWAVKKYRISVSPVVGIEPAPTGEFQAWTMDQALLAEAKLPEHLRRVVILGRHTGQRRGDLCAMTWDAYDGTFLRFTQQKKKPRETPVSLALFVSDALKAELDTWKATANPDVPNILVNYLGRPFVPRSLTQVLARKLEKIGLHDLGIHGLRKLKAAELAAAGCSTHEIASITGHKTLGMIQHYTKSADQRRLSEMAEKRLQLIYNSRSEEETDS